MPAHRPALPTIAVIAFLGLGFYSSAAGKLEVGAEPPTLRIAEWIRGEPVVLADLKGQSACVIEFMATWSPACLLSLPERAALQKRLAGKGLVYIAVTDESPRQVRAVIDPYPGGLGIRIGCDDAARTFNAFPFSTGDFSLPYAVVVDRQGLVAWMGDPRGTLEKVVEQVVDGSWDRGLADKLDDGAVAGGRPSEKPAGEANQGSSRDASGPLACKETVADLLHLQDFLQLNYAGYDDLEWKLLCKESSWAERTRAFAARLEARKQWTLEEFYPVIREYLDPVEDSHFWITGPETLMSKLPGRREFLTRRYDPWFTDLTLRAEDGGYVVVDTGLDPEELKGLLLDGVPVATVEGAVLGTPLLFPTVPGEAGAHDYLLGGFFHETPEEPLDLSFRDPAGNAVPAQLEVFRGTAQLRSSVFKPWELRRTPDRSWPWLCVRTMIESSLDETFQATAGTLRGEPVAVLDLRRNGGGSDRPAMDWCPAFSAQDYKLIGWADMARGVRAGKARWRSGMPMISGVAKPAPYEGRLFVLIDRHVASSGETFVRYACQIPGAVLLGENTMGCATYGNCDIVEQLPASGFTVRFGHSKFVNNVVRPIRECVGFFPDYWLKEPVFEEAIASLLGLEDGQESESR